MGALLTLPLLQMSIYDVLFSHMVYLACVPLHTELSHFMVVDCLDLVSLFYFKT